MYMCIFSSDGVVKVGRKYGKMESLNLPVHYAVRGVSLWLLFWRSLWGIYRNSMFYPIRLFVLYTLARV